MLNETDIKNVLVFLSRVQLTGNEAPTFMELVAKLQSMQKPVVEVVDVEKTAEEETK